MNLVFFDIDGTLANGLDVPESAQKALRQLREHGDLVWICTGRNIHYVKKNFHQYANGYICSNGRESYTCCSKIGDHPLSDEEVRHTIETLDAIGAGYAFFANEGAFYGGPEEGYDVMAAVQRGNMKRGIPEKMRAYNFDIWYRDHAMYEAVEKAFEGFAVLNPHGPHPSADVTILGHDKGTAVREVAEYMHVPIENTYAFGDGINDLYMLEAAGHGIAMGNARDELKERAEFVTSDINDDGVMNGLKHYKLI